MLSRVADNLYWMSRYLERVEHTARLVDVNLQQMLEQSTEEEHLRWDRLRASLLSPSRGENAEDDDAYTMMESFTFDTNNPASIVSSIASARENARQVRELISSEMWEQINRLYLQIRHTTIDEVWFSQPHAYLASVKEGVQLFHGITDASMNHSEGWHFIRLGRFLERAYATAALLDVNFRAFFDAEQNDMRAAIDHMNYIGWVGLLRSCAAFEAYCKVYTAANIQPRSIAEFLLFNPESPRSIRFAGGLIQSALQSIARSTNTRPNGRVERLAGRFRSALEYDQIEDVVGDMHAYLETIQRQCTQIHNAIYQMYIVYPVEVALIERGAAQA
ncbi:MAG: alpha-E domain-containing protein [Ktedonobacteraceae bacterium]|nr:alpha-E domain-containing protein [Ktedonobacteraceae bacterium]